MKIQFSRYTLIKKNRVNAKDLVQPQNGVLLKVIDDLQNWGVADLCPWPSLGDRTLADEISARGHLFKRAVQLATEDQNARKEKRSLLQNKWVKNNVLITDYKNFNFQDGKLVGQTLKIKADTDVFTLAQKLKTILDKQVLRLDFNSCLNQNLFNKFLLNLDQRVLNSIEYIEDPTPYESKDWSQWNQSVPLAYDLQPQHIPTAEKIEADYMILKPTRQPLPPARQKFTITSAMDHPVGVAHALRYAQHRAQNDSGLLTIDLYEETPFDPYFIYQNSVEINFSDSALNDFGIGMTVQLNQLAWENLS